ncbi:hypothetical protein DFP74_4100 [Nocardiopsis sp. Huas11]|nr:hypothetical protein [Nocardiopsis sp. Huas11]RKS08403.1 hypothetical protein DFP74_4100 [Nocardiopsis sp. Huas11]
MKGAGFAVLGPVFAIGMAVGTRRYQARALAARDHGHGYGYGYGH